MRQAKIAASQPQSVSFVESKKSDKTEWQNVYPDGMTNEMLECFNAYHKAKERMANIISKEVGYLVAVSINPKNVGFIKATGYIRKNEARFK